MLRKENGGGLIKNLDIFWLDFLSSLMNKETFLILMEDKSINHEFKI